jgi:hypothetical protein
MPTTRSTQYQSGSVAARVIRFLALPRSRLVSVYLLQWPRKPDQSLPRGKVCPTLRLMAPVRSAPVYDRYMLRSTRRQAQ